MTAQYAQEHFADMAKAADRGEDVEIERAGKPRLRFIVDQTATVLARSKSVYWARLKDRFGAEDWDSAETNKEIEDLFEGSTLFSVVPVD